MLPGCTTKRHLELEPSIPRFPHYRMPLGTTLRYRTSLGSLQNFEMMGQAVEITARRAYVFSLRSEGLKDTNYHLHVTIDSMNASVITPEADVSPDVSSMVGKSFEMILSPLGREHDLPGVESLKYELTPGRSTSIAPDFRTLFPDLAGKPVEIGGTWVTRDTIAIDESSTELRIILNSVNTLAGFETVDNLECARITAAVTGTLDGQGEQGGAILTFEGRVAGSELWHFANREGLLVSAHSNISTMGAVNVAGPQVMTIPMTMDIDVETTLLR